MHRIVILVHSYSRILPALFKNMQQRTVQCRGRGLTVMRAVTQDEATTLGQCDRPTAGQRSGNSQSELTSHDRRLSELRRLRFEHRVSCCSDSQQHHDGPWWNSLCLYLFSLRWGCGPADWSLLPLSTSPRGFVVIVVLQLLDFARYYDGVLFLKF